MRGEFRVRWAESYRYSLIISRGSKNFERTTSMDSLKRVKRKPHCQTIGRTTTALRKTEMRLGGSRGSVKLQLYLHSPYYKSYSTKYLCPGNCWEISPPSQAGKHWAILLREVCQNVGDHVIIGSSRRISYINPGVIKSMMLRKPLSIDHYTNILFYFVTRI